MPHAFYESEPIKDKLVTLQFGSVVQTHDYAVYSVFSSYHIENLRNTFIKAAQINCIDTPNESLRPPTIFPIGGIRSYIGNWDFDRVQRAYLLPYIEQKHHELAETLSWIHRTSNPIDRILLFTPEIVKKPPNSAL